MNIDLINEEKNYIKEIYPISKTAVGSNRQDRLVQTHKWFLEKYSEYKKYPKSIYLLIDDMTQVLQPQNGE